MVSRLCLLMGLLAFLAACSSMPSDVAIVQCTAPAQRERTVDGAISLGLAAKDSKPDRILTNSGVLTFEEWRDRKPDEFARTCDAVSPVAPSPLRTQAIAALVSLATFVLGAAATWFTTTWRDGINRRKQQADALHKACQAFAGAVRDYCDARLDPTADPGPPPTQDMRHKRDDLAAQLIRVKALRPKWTAPETLRAELAEGVLNDDVEENWQIEQSREERRPRADEVNKAVNELDRRVDVVVRALERPHATRPELLREFPVGAAS